MNSTKALIQKYYEAFNSQNLEVLLECLHPEVIHDINEGDSEIGVHKFRQFLHRMNLHYKEHLHDIVIMLDESGRHACAKFVVHGTYLQTDGGLPPARGQKYEIPALGVFEVENQRIRRVATYYNLKKWIELVR